jgi:hypothetical protein
MDMTVAGIGAVVVAELRGAGYMESTVGQYAKTIKALVEFASGREYSAELGEQFASMTTSGRTGRFSPQRRFDYRRLVAVFDSYVQTGRVDLSVRGRGGGGPRPEGSDFVALDAAWEAEMGRRGLAPATREAYGRVARGYLVFLESRGIALLDGADGGSVLAFLESLLDRWARSFCVRPVRFSPRRSSTADWADRGLHRRASRAVRGRADLSRADPAWDTDRPVDVLRGAARQGGRAHAGAGA